MSVLIIGCRMLPRDNVAANVASVAAENVLGAAVWASVDTTYDEHNSGVVVCKAYLPVTADLACFLSATTSRQ